MRVFLSGILLAALALVALPADKSRAAPLGVQVPTRPGIEQVADATGCGPPKAGNIVVTLLNGMPLVTVQGNGVPLKLVLDTGAQRSVLTTVAAERIGARRPQVEFKRGLQGVAGALPTYEVELQSFAIGQAEIPWRRVTVAAITMPPGSPTPLDGILGADVLSAFNIDLDLPRRRMVLYEKGACAPNWPGRYAEIAVGRSLNHHLFLPVQLDGRSLTAIIDTGAQRTTLTLAAARAIGLTDAVLARDRPYKIRGATGGELIARLHRFQRLSIGPVGVYNPEIVVAELKTRNSDIVLGADILSTRRLFLSYAAFRIFLSH